jgi:WD40 repeat protein
MMKNVQLFVLVLFSNSVLFSMENESKNPVTQYRDSNNQIWRVDKETQFNNTRKDFSGLFKKRNILTSVCFDPTGTKIMAFPSICADCFVCMFDRDGKELERLDKNAFDAFDTLSEINNQWVRELFTSGNSPLMHAALIYDENASELLDKRFGHCTMQCFNEGQAFVVPQFRVYSGDNVHAWNHIEDKILFSLKHQGPVQSVDFNPQGIEIITASSDGTVRLWNKKDGKELLCIKYPTRVMSASFNSTGTEMVVATDDGKIQILVKEESQ